ncbi:MAG: tetratricopeptide repeat protein [Parasphingorhabdus sp.]|uniref:tetratricopeptide repeat protein n=2 Tax=Parasphingorhabdus sp. TaxID=2709688 RepID=UPI003264A4C2
MSLNFVSNVRGYRKPAVLVAVLALAVASMPTAISAASEGNAEARKAFANAQEFRATGDARSARIELMNAIKADPNWADARVAQAEVLLKLSDGIAAEAELLRAMELGQEPAPVRHLLGHALALQGKVQKARDQLLADDIPLEHQAHAARMMGNVALQLGDRQLARMSFNRSMKLDEKNPDLWVDIARFRSEFGDQAGATNAVEEAVKLGPENVRALQYRGELLRFQFGLGAALPWFERALLIDPNNVPLLTEYAATLGDMGRMTEMLTIARKIIALDGRNPRAFFMQAVLAARAGNYSLARRLMHKTEGAIDEVPAVLLLQGIIEHGEDNHNAAVDKFARLVSIQPNNRQAQNLLARSLYLAGSALDSVEVLKSQVNRSGAAPYALWQAARGLEAIDERGQATGVLNRAAIHDIGKESAIRTEISLNVLQAEAQRSPNDARTVIPYIRALYSKGDYANALVEAKRLQRGNPGASPAHVLVADVAATMGNYDEALDALQQARSIRFSEPVMLRLIEVLRSKGALQESGEVLAQYLNFNPINIAGLRWMAYSHLETESWAVAAHILENLRKRIGENDVLIMAGLAQAYAGLGQTEKAIAAGRIAYRVQPSSPVVSHLYGLALLQDETRTEDAVSLLKKAVAIRPDNVDYQKSLKRASAQSRANVKKSES